MLVIHFDIPRLEQEIKELENITNNPEFWTKSQNSTSVLSKLKELSNKVNMYKKLNLELSNLQDLNDLLLDEYDKDLSQELINNTNNLVAELEKLELNTLLSGKYDKNNAILTLHPGAGGTESQDWAEMLYRMYSKWAISNNYSVKELYFLEGDEAGIKSVTFLISGEYAYGYLKGEMGVHRLVRISPFDSRRKTSHFFCIIRGITRNNRRHRIRYKS